MTVNPEYIEPLIGLLRNEPGFEHAELAAAPQPLAGGFWASMSLLSLANVAPPADRLVLRVMPDQALAAKETVLHREVARQGLPVPAIRLAGDSGGGLGDAFLLMDHAPGHPPLPGLGGMAAVRRLPSLARHLPELLGQVTAALHALDPGPVGIALEAESIEAPCEPLAFLAALTQAADRLGRADLHTAARWLAGHPPPAGPAVVAHGDLHPFNLLVDGDRWTLLDWTTALVADPAYDLAFTMLMLRHPPLTSPAPLRPVISTVGAGLARRFAAAYRRAGGSVPCQQTLSWYTSLHALRILTEFAGWQHASAVVPGHASHPWTALSPVAASVLRRTTSTTIALPAA